MMGALVELVENNQAFLTKRILHYAKLHDYVKYTSTLEEAWAMSIKGLSSALVTAVKTDEAVPEIVVDHHFTDHAILAFGVLEARKHRGRGISLEMFLSFFKYYRQTYLDFGEHAGRTDGTRFSTVGVRVRNGLFIRTGHKGFRKTPYFRHMPAVP